MTYNINIKIQGGSKNLDYYLKFVARVCDGIEQHSHVNMLIRSNSLHNFVKPHYTKITILRSGLTVTYLCSGVTEFIEAENVPFE